MRRKVLPALDDEFAKDLGLDSLEALRERVRADLSKDARAHAEREQRDDLLRQLAGRVRSSSRGADRARSWIGASRSSCAASSTRASDPMKAGIDWEQFRTKQRDAALDTVKATLMLDEVARREAIEVPRRGGGGRTAAVRGRCRGARWRRCAPAWSRMAGWRAWSAGMRRDRAVEFLMSRATILDV